MQATVAAQAPFPQARFAAITQLAVFEAVNAITKEYKPYLSTSRSAPAGASADAAAVAAAHMVLKTYFPASAATLDAARASSLAAIPDGTAKSAGIAVGESGRRGGYGGAEQRWILTGRVLSSGLVQTRRMANHGGLHRRREEHSINGGT